MGEMDNLVSRNRAGVAMLSRSAAGCTEASFADLFARTEEMPGGLTTLLEHGARRDAFRPLPSAKRNGPGVDRHGHLGLLPVVPTRSAQPRRDRPDVRRPRHRRRQSRRTRHGAPTRGDATAGCGVRRGIFDARSIAQAALHLFVTGWTARRSATSPCAPGVTIERFYSTVLQHGRDPPARRQSPTRPPSRFLGIFGTETHPVGGACTIAGGIGKTAITKPSVRSSLTSRAFSTPIPSPTSAPRARSFWSGSSPWWRWELKKVSSVPFRRPGRPRQGWFGYVLSPCGESGRAERPRRARRGCTPRSPPNGLRNRTD
jgi:hypothetical protein